MKRYLVGIAYALAGLLLAVALTAGAYAVAGRELSRPARPVRLPVGELRLAPEPTESPSPEDSPSVDDKGGDRNDDDKSDDDNSGSGSSNSGSGSSNSGSGSSNSGSGSDDDKPDDD